MSAEAGALAGAGGVPQGQASRSGHMSAAPDATSTPSPPPFSVVVRVGELRHQMHIRGLTGAELARRAGISAATVSHALNGRRIHPRKLMAMVAALVRVEPMPGIDALVDVGSAFHTEDAT